MNGQRRCYRHPVPMDFEVRASIGGDKENLETYRDEDDLK